MRQRITVGLVGVGCVVAAMICASAQDFSPNVQGLPQGGLGALPELKAGAWSEGAGIKVARSKSGRTLHAYFPSAGQWIKLDERFAPEDRIVPSMMSGLVGLKVGNRAYAFSAESGTWGKLDVPEAASPFLSSDLISVAFDDKLAEFSKAGRWSVLDLSQD